MEQKIKLTKLLIEAEIMRIVIVYAWCFLTQFIRPLTFVLRAKKKKKILKKEIFNRLFPSQCAKKI